MESKDMSKAKAVSTNRVKKSREDWIFDIILYTIGVLLIIITLYPMSVSYTHLTLPTNSLV